MFAFLQLSIKTISILAKMGFFQRFLPPNDRYAALLLYGMVFSTCFNGYDAGIMTVILADPQFRAYYAVNSTKQGVIATIPWASTGKSLGSISIPHISFKDVTQSCNCICQTFGSREQNNV